MHVPFRRPNNQKTAVIVHASDLTPRLRQRTTASMFISQQTRHLVWDSNYYFSFFIFQLVGLVFFFTKLSQKKLTPDFADRFGQCGRPKIGNVHIPCSRRRIQLVCGKAPCAIRISHLPSPVLLPGERGMHPHRKTQNTQVSLSTSAIITYYDMQPSCYFCSFCGLGLGVFFCACVAI